MRSELPDPRALAFLDALAEAVAAAVVRDLEHAASLSPLDRLDEGRATARGEALVT